MSKQHLDVEVGLARPEEQADIWKLYQQTYLDTYIDEKAGFTREKLTGFLESNSSYLPKNWQKYLKTPSKERTVYVARHKGKVVGMVAPVFVDGKHRITALYVAPELQHMGIGTKLMQVALSHHGNVDIYAGLASHVKHLPSFYQPFGFEVLNPGELKQYPTDPMSYIEMMRPRLLQTLTN